jgi:gamma-glutamyltranspeptidase/glutathione hydrolase
MAAVAMMQKGGNAVDAAVAAAFAIGVVEPDGSGLGGGGGMLIYMARERRSTYINYYPCASSKVEGVGFNSRTDAQTARAILVPGTAAGLTLALEKYGTLPLATILAPAIRYAEEGFPIDETLAKIILDNVPLVQRDSATAAVYLRDGFPFMEGDTLRQPELAATLRAIAVEGRAGFYEGPVAARIVRGVNDAGGAMTPDDLRFFKAEVREPLRGSYRECEVLTAPPPHSGALVLEALNTLENEDVRSLGNYATSAEAMHLIAETLRRVYADRTAFLADPRFEDVPVPGLISKDFARTRYLDINPDAADPRDYRKTRAGNPTPFDGVPAKASTERVAVPAGGEYEWDDDEDEGRSSFHRWGDDLFGTWGNRKKPRSNDRGTAVQKPDSVRRAISPDVNEPEACLPPGNHPPLVGTVDLLEEPGHEGGGHTTHLGVMDKDGNVVSLTQTLGTFFGSGVTTAGVLMNNAMSNFSTTTAVNGIQPGKQPRSSISPTILLKNGVPYMSVGSPGATRIIATVVQLIVNVVDYGMSAQDANSAPRFLCQKADDYLHLESRIAPAVQEALKQKGHTLRVYGDFDLFFGGAQLILFDPSTGTFSGSADPRRGGVAVGY